MKTNARQRAIPQNSIDIRCSCHRLLARQEGNVIIIKCPRCKRETRIELVNRNIVLKDAAGPD